MSHDEVYIFFRALAPSMAVRSLCWYPCGENTIRLVFKEGPEYCFTLGDNSSRDYHIRTYGEWSKEEFPEDPEKSYQAWRKAILAPNYKPDTSKPYERNYPYEIEAGK